MKKKLLILAVAILTIVSVLTMTACSTEKTTLLFGKELIKLETQMDILTNLKTQSSDIGVMDSVMANYLLSTDSNFANDLQVVENSVFVQESYGIGAKKGNSALMSKINEAIIALTKDGTVATIATKYNLQDKMLVTSETVDPLKDAKDESFNAIKNSKKLIIGYTVFKPIAFTENDVLTGFDIDLANKVVLYLNTTYGTEIVLEPKIINWNTKEVELTNGSIDLIWNGMTITDERVANMEIGLPYMKNEQVAVIRKADFAKYGTIGAFAANQRNAIVSVEEGSAAMSLVEIKTK